MIDKYIYSEITSELLYYINRTILECLNYRHNPRELIPENENLISCFEPLTETIKDLHIREGLFESHQTRGQKVYPRILKLTLNAFKDAQEIKGRRKTKLSSTEDESHTIIIPSPLHILYYALIVPEYPQTAAYSLASCRTLLFNLLEKNYKELHPKAEHDLINSITEVEISASMDSLSKNINIGARWPTKNFNIEAEKPRRTYSNLLVGHFLSMKGITHLWFKNIEDAKKYLTYDKVNLLKLMSTRLVSPRFRLSSRYEELPETGELVNQLFGVPIPIKGAEVVFYGGLKPSSSGGMVIGISGQAGIGKTSFALALANSLSPLGIKCLYISLEEDERDILKRLFSLQSTFEKELSFYRKPREWFFVTKSKESLRLPDLMKILDTIKVELKIDLEKKDNIDCNSIIVIDNLNSFYESKDEYSLIQKIIEKLRSLKSIVILIGGEDVLEKLRLEYLIDIGLKLKHEGLDEEGEKPLRLFNLYKTRHQLSRQGTHVFHMSGNEGFRISPQIPSQMDRKEKLRKFLFDESRVIHALNYLNDDIKKPLRSTKTNMFSSKKGENIERIFIKLYPRTHILVHGYGSASKAGFGLKILLTPPLDNGVPIGKISSQNYSNSLFRRKVLIISFLYPKEYYVDVVNGETNLKGIIKNKYPNLQDPIIDYLIYYPGYISPEDFINKITRRLDQAILEGQAFNGVLIDGLHNVFLQFKRLQDNDMVWPLLYNILARYDVTVVSTFTNFAMNDRLLDDDPDSKNKMVNQAVSDHMLLQKGMTPFLHALVKASDFYFFLEQIVYRKGERKYLLSIKSAIKQNVPTELLEWDRQRNVFVNIHQYKEILKELNNEEIIELY